MKKHLLSFLLISFLFASANAQSTKTSSYGDKITAENAIDVASLTEKVHPGDTLHIKVSGTVKSVCQKKGCWMKMDMGHGNTMMVHFKDYGFFVPKDCSGKKLIMEGIAFIDVTSIEQLRHYAEDAGKSAEDIAKINDPEEELTFEASGLLLYNE